MMLQMKRVIHTLLVLMLTATMCMDLTPAHAQSAQALTLEQFGGQAYYKRFDGQLTYTPASVDDSFVTAAGLEGKQYTRITWTGQGEAFAAEDQGKKFVGLFAHQNPGHIDPDYSDAYYPNIIGSRYATIVKVIDGQNMIVDFEFNGGNIDKPQVLRDAKGYIFFDNSEAWSRLWEAFTSPDSQATEVRLGEYAQDGLVQRTYVIPQHRTAKMPGRSVKVWTGTARKARVKMGIEDYFQWDRYKGKLLYAQDKELFQLHPGDFDLIIHNIVWTPPHRAVPESSTFTRSFFARPNPIQPCARTLAIIGNTALDEQRDIQAKGKLTHEHIRCIGVGFVHSGGKYEGEGIARDIVDYQYILLKDFEHNGAGLIDLKANSGAGNYLVMENVTGDFADEEKWQPSSIKVEGRFTADKSGMDPGLIERDYYPKEVFEITSGHSFQQVDNSFHIHGWGNRANIIHIDRFVFAIGSHSTWQTIYERLFNEGKPQFDWRRTQAAATSPMRTGRKHMVLQRIPRAGEKYVISRDYTVHMGTVPRTLNQLSPDTVRGFANWSLILQKKLEDIDPVKDIPVNAKPIQLQAGDQFRIVGRGDTLYTVLDNNRGPWSQFNTEYDGKESYIYTRHKLDQPLPQDLPLAFEIEMVTSTSEVLLDGKVRPAWVVYKSNQGWPVTTKTQFGDKNAVRGDPLGHMSYNHRQFALWARNVKHAGKYRESSMTRPVEFTVKHPESGEEVKVRSLGDYSPGYTLINSSGFMGEFSGGRHDFAVRALILKSLGRELPDHQMAKMRLYNCKNINIPSRDGSEKFVEVHETEEGAPDMPEACRKLLNSLPGSN